MDPTRTDLRLWSLVGTTSDKKTLDLCRARDHLERRLLSSVPAPPKGSPQACNFVVFLSARAQVRHQRVRVFLPSTLRNGCGKSLR